MKKLLTLLLLFPVYLFAQKGTESYSCCQGHNPCIQIYGSANLAKHNCEVHGIGCNVNSGNYENRTGSTKKGVAIAAGAVLLGAAGYVYGNTIKDENGQTKALDYGTIGLVGGAVTGAVVNVAFSKKTKGGYDAVRGKRRFFDNTALRFSGNSIGIVVIL